MAKVVLGVKVEAEMRSKLEVIASENSISYADQTRMFLLAGIQDFEKKHGKIKLEVVKEK